MHLLIRINKMNTQGDDAASRRRISKNALSVLVIFSIYSGTFLSVSLLRGVIDLLLGTTTLTNEPPLLLYAPVAAIWAMFVARLVRVTGQSYAGQSKITLSSALASDETQPVNDEVLELRSPANGARACYTLSFVFAFLLALTTMVANSRSQLTERALVLLPFCVCGLILFGIFAFVCYRLRAPFVRFDSCGINTLFTPAIVDFFVPNPIQSSQRVTWIDVIACEFDVNTLELGATTRVLSFVLKGTSERFSLNLTNYREYETQMILDFIKAVRPWHEHQGSDLR